MITPSASVRNMFDAHKRFAISTTTNNILEQVDVGGLGLIFDDSPTQMTMNGNETNADSDH
jgi:hypothetical protein